MPDLATRVRRSWYVLVILSFIVEPHPSTAFGIQLEELVAGFLPIHHLHWDLVLPAHHI